MSTGFTALSSSTQPDEQTIGGRTNTAAMLEAFILNVDHDALQEHLDNNQTEQSILDRCLMLGLQTVQRKEQKIERIAPALLLLLQSGAKWNPDTWLERQMTPYHLICLSAGDHHDLLDLLIQSSEQTLLHAKDYYKYTALMYAVENANINCLRSLIAHGAEVKIEYSKRQPVCPSSHKLQEHSKQTSLIMIEIFDLLLDYGVDLNKAIRTAMSLGNIECMKKLMAKGAKLDNENGYVLGCLFNRCIGKNPTGQYGGDVLWWVTKSGKVDAIRYMLDLGVTMPTNMNVIETRNAHELCKQCGLDMLVIDAHERNFKHPFLEAIRTDNLDVVQLFEEYGSKSFESFSVFRLAMIFGSVNVIEYLHRKYRHPLNINYTNPVPDRLFEYRHLTLLKEACYCRSIKSAQYLSEHGVDKVDLDRCPSALIVAIQSSYVEFMALLIRNGVDVNFRSYDYRWGYVLPFEAAVLHELQFYCVLSYAVEMLLVCGCSCGVFSLKEDHPFKVKQTNIELKNLMTKWNVQENNAKPLKQQCRRMLLIHLSPRASKMIEKLPLPQCLIKYLSFPELDDIVARYKLMQLSYRFQTKTWQRMIFLH